jgi:lysophospholipase L1-like esterase
MVGSSLVTSPANAGVLAKTPRRWIAVLVLLLVSASVVAGVILVAELVLEQRFANTLYRAARRHPPHPFLQVLASAQVSHVNASGFRGDAIAIAKPPGGIRIFTLGGSTSLGVANTYEETYPFLLQQRLTREFPNVPVEVQNAGVAWHATPHMLANYELRIRQYQPDIVIVYEAINDLYRGFSPSWWASGPFTPDYAHYLGPYIRFLGPDVESITATQDEWLLWRLVRRRLFGEPTPYDYRHPNVAKLMTRLREREVARFPSLDSYRDYFARLVTNLRRDGITVAVASQPFLYRDGLTPAERDLLYFGPVFAEERGEYPSVASMMNGMRQFNAASRQIAEAAHVDYLDFDAAVPKTSEYFTDDVHLTAKGYEIQAQLVYEWLLRSRLIPPRPR